MIYNDEEGPLAALRLEDYCLLSAILLLPFAFGGVEIWAYRMASFLLATAAALFAVREGWKRLLPGKGERWLVPAFLLAVWAIVQVLPLPPSILATVSPGADKVYRHSFPGYTGEGTEDSWPFLVDSALQQVPEASSIPSAVSREEEFTPETAVDLSGWRPLSLHPRATAERIFWYIALLAAFLVLRCRLREPDVYRSYMIAIFGMVTVLALSGLLQKLYWNGKLLWIRTPHAGGGRSLGPYINPTHFGGVMEMAVPWLVGYAWMTIRRSGWEAFKKPQGPLAVGAALICLLAALDSASKMVAVTLMIALTVLVLLGLERWRSRIIAFSALAAGWILAILTMARTTLGSRMLTFMETSGHELSHYERVVAWKASLPMLRDYLWTGVGFGAFGQVFPAYIPAGEQRIWERVHNDFLEVFLEGGVIAGVLMLCLLLGFWWKALSMRTESVGPVPNTARIGLLLGVCAIAAHGLVDFNHQIPANALLFVALSAMAVSRRTDRTTVAS